jgi:1-deoxy-D-xylulose-5-phosphate synthase
MVEVCEQAAHELETHGIGATVWDVRCASPLDPTMLDDARRHEVVITVEDGVIEGGVGASIGALLRAAGPGGNIPAIASCGLPLRYFAQGKADRILAGLGLDGPQLAKRALALCASAGIVLA